MKYFVAIFGALLLVSHVVQALETGCQFQPGQLNEFGSRITLLVDKENRSLPHKIPIQSEFELKLHDGVLNYYGTFEGFFRPQEDNFFSLVPVPILGFDVSKERVVVYICAHYTENPEDSHMTIYFMRGHHIDPINLNNFVGDIFYDPSLKVKAVPASLIGISEFRKFFLQIFRYIPFVDVYFETWSLLQTVFANAIGDITGIGVERIELTRTYLRVSSGVNLNSPREARISRTFKLKRRELGTGASAAETTKKTFKDLDENSVLYGPDTLPMEYEENP